MDAVRNTACIIERPVALPKSLTTDSARLEYCYRMQQRLIQQSRAIEPTLRGQALHDWQHDWLERLCSVHAVLCPLVSRVLGKLDGGSDADMAALWAYKQGARAKSQYDAAVDAHPIFTPSPSRVEMVDPYEDFTAVNWTETDVPGRLTIAANTITVTGMLRNADVYHVGDYTAGHFGVNFTHNSVVNWTSADSGGAGGYWEVSNVIDDLLYIYTNYSAAMGSRIVRSGSNYGFYLTDFKTRNGDSFIGTSANCGYDINLLTPRTGATGAVLTQTLRKASDNSLIDALSVTCTATTAYRYAIPVSSWNSTGTEPISFVVKNLDLNEIVPGHARYLYDRRRRQ